MKKKRFVLPATSIIQIKKTISALRKVGQPVTAADLQRPNNKTLHESAVSKSFQHLVQLGVISSKYDGGHKKFSLTSLGNNLADAITRSPNPIQAVPYWREAVNNVTIYKDLITYIANIPSIQRKDLVEEIISRVGSVQNSSTVERANVVIDILAEAELIKVMTGRSKPYDFISVPEAYLNEISTSPEDDFLSREFEVITFESMGLDEQFTNVLIMRVNEIKKCSPEDAPSSVIYLAGSVLEGVLYAVALRYPGEFKQSKSAPKHKGKVKEFPEWTLSNFIDVANEVGLIQKDAKTYSHSLKEFRNYIHPREQVRSEFNPKPRTAKISLQVLMMALHDLAVNIATR